MRSRIGFIVLLLLGSSIWGDDRTKWSFEFSSGYDAGVSQGASWITYGNSDSNYTYFSEKRNAIGNSGIHGELRLGYDFFDNFGLTVASSFLFSTPTLSSAYSYGVGGSVIENWSDSFNYASIRITPSVRYWFSKASDLNFYGTIGGMIVIPSPINETSTVDTLMNTTQLKYGLGLGAQSELGGEYLFGQTWGFSFALALEKISLPRVSSDYVPSSGAEIIVNYVDSPSTDSNDQTAGDVAKSTKYTKYYTSPTYYDDFSDVSFKIGLIWHF